MQYYRHFNKLKRVTLKKRRFRSSPVILSYFSCILLVIRFNLYYIVIIGKRLYIMFCKNKWKRIDHMATLKDVARLACVDVSTVSRALNNTSYVHPDTKARIFAAVKELSYQPNVLAQGLRQGKRHTIGVVVPRLHLTLFADITQSIESESRKLGYATLICHTEDDPVIEKECLNRLRNGFVDGIIIAGRQHQQRHCRLRRLRLRHRQIPLFQGLPGNRPDQRHHKPCALPGAL